MDAVCVGIGVVFFGVTWWLTYALGRLDGGKTA